MHFARIAKKMAVKGGIGESLFDSEKHEDKQRCREAVKQSAPIARALIGATKHKHSAIAHLFHEGLGLKFQYQDSEMAERVMRALVNRGIPVLGVHDSFITPSRHQEILQEEMAKSARQNGLLSDETKLMKIKANSQQGITGREGRGGVTPGREPLVPWCAPGSM